MPTRIQYELHSSRLIPQADSADDSWQYFTEEESDTSILPLCFDADAPHFAWIGADAESGDLCVVDDEAKGIAGFTVVHRRLGPALGMVAKRPGLLVNALPALDFHALGPRDCLVLAPGVMTCVTERFFPHAGPPLPEHLGLRCPCCKIEVTSGTHVVSCRCGCVYHNESAQSHPDLDAEDRLNCFEKVRVCLSCNRPLTLDPVLVWDPEETSACSP